MERRKRIALALAWRVLILVSFIRLVFLALKLPLMVGWLDELDLDGMLCKYCVMDEWLCKYIVLSTDYTMQHKRRVTEGIKNGPLQL